MSQIHPLGWRPERPGSPLLVPPFGLDIPSHIPDEGGFDAEEWVRDQLWDSCTGQTAGYFPYLLAGEKCSGYMPWTYGRIREFGPDLWRIDSGISMGAALEAWSANGCCLDERWRPGVEGFGRDELPSALDRLDAQSRNLECGVLYEREDALVEAACTHLSMRHPIGIALDVDAAFDGCRSAAPIGPLMGPSRGGHIVPATRYRTVKGERQIRIVNSWSSLWGDQGGAWLSATRVQQALMIVFCSRIS